jgi:3-hydroxymyristoyl/3-hydroxydecanoyl-(acyl carrier protein) dehydratase
MLRMDYVGMQPNRGKFEFIGDVKHLISDYKIAVEWHLCSSYWFFEDHWPGNPTVPAVIQLEAIFQNSALIFFSRAENREDFIYVTRVLSASFHRKLIPGDTVTIEASVQGKRRKFAQISSIMRLHSEIVCKCTFEVYLEHEIEF